MHSEEIWRAILCQVEDEGGKASKDCTSLDSRIDIQRPRHERTREQDLSYQFHSPAVECCAARSWNALLPLWSLFIFLSNGLIFSLSSSFSVLSVTVFVLSSILSIFYIRYSIFTPSLPLFGFVSTRSSSLAFLYRLSVFGRLLFDFQTPVVEKKGCNGNHARYSPQCDCQGIRILQT